MAPSPKSEAQEGFARIYGAAAESAGLARERLAIDNALRVDPSSAANLESAEASMLQDIDAILSRIGDGITRERKAMDDLFERVRQSAA